MQSMLLARNMPLSRTHTHEHSHTLLTHRAYHTIFSRQSIEHQGIHAHINMNITIHYIRTGHTARFFLAWAMPWYIRAHIHTHTHTRPQGIPHDSFSPEHHQDTLSCVGHGKSVINQSRGGTRSGEPLASRSRSGQLNSSEKFLGWFRKIIKNLFISTKKWKNVHGGTGRFSLFLYKWWVPKLTVLAIQTKHAPLLLSPFCHHSTPVSRCSLQPCAK